MTEKWIDPCTNCRLIETIECDGEVPEDERCPIKDAARIDELVKDLKLQVKLTTKLIMEQNKTIQRADVLESALKWLADHLERPGGTSASEWMERAIKHGRAK